MLIVQSFLTDVLVVERLLFVALFLAVVLAAIRTLSPSPKRLTTAMILGTIAVMGSVIVEWYPDDRLLTVVYGSYTGIFVLPHWQIDACV